MRALACICMHTQHCHYFISVFFSCIFFLILPFSKTNFRYTIYHLFESNKNPVVVPDLGPFWLGKKSPDDTNHLTQPHSMWSNTACWFIGKDGLSNAISEDPNEVTEFCGVS